MARVITLKWGNKYGPEYVNILHSRIKHFNPDWEFVCYTENALGLDPDIDARPLPTDLGLYGWWFKIWIFNQLHEGENIFLDLDVLVTGALDHFLPPPIHNERCHIGIIQNGHKINSSCVSWRDTVADVWDVLASDWERHLAQRPPYGDQEILEIAMTKRVRAHWFSPLAIAWLRVAREGGGARNLLETTRLIICKGPRNPHDHPDHPLIKEYWRAIT